MPFGFTHYPLRGLAGWSLTSFFREIDVLGTENFPPGPPGSTSDGPLVIACSHSNMAVDPAVLSCTMPRKIPLHYWVKDSLFANPAVGALLVNAGNIPVDRKNKNNQSLFKGTFQALEMGECVAVFPEGTSHTSPHMLQFRDGTSWAALEYVKYLSDKGVDIQALKSKELAGQTGTQLDLKGGQGSGPKLAKIVPVGITYVDKSKYRSRIVVEYGPPIDVSEFIDEFMSGDEGSAKSAVKKLTRKLELEMMKITVNAPDWDSLVAGKMARELLWEKEGQLAPEHLVKVSQTLTDLFSPPDLSPSAKSLRSLLTTYNSLLTVSKLTNQQLADLPLPKDLHPSSPVPLPSRFSTLSLLVRDSLAYAVRLPFYTLPLLIHAPVYVMAEIGANIAKEELETQAQMKIAFGLLFSLLVYPFVFVVMCLFMGWTSVGALVAFGSVYAFNMSHTTAVDQVYDRWKALIGAWRVLIGVWRLKRDIPFASVQTYLPASSAPAGATMDAASWQKGVGPSAASAKSQKRKSVPTRRLIKHVLRARVEAARGLEAYLAELDETDESVNARIWLAEQGNAGQPVELSDDEHRSASLPTSKRSGREVVRFLKAKGARISDSSLVHSHWSSVSGDEGGFASPLLSGSQALSSETADGRATTYTVQGKSLELLFDPKLLPPAFFEGGPSGIYERFDKLKACLDTYHTVVFVDNARDQIIASGTLIVECKFLRNAGKVGHIEDIAVDPSCKGTGIGKRLILGLEALSRSVGCYKTILDCNEGNIGFYQKCGFTQKEFEMVKYAPIAVPPLAVDPPAPVDPNRLAPPAHPPNKHSSSSSNLGGDGEPTE